MDTQSVITHTFYYHSLTEKKIESFKNTLNVHNKI